MPNLNTAQTASPAQSTFGTACSLFKNITCLLRGVHSGGILLPDALGDFMLMKPSPLPKVLDLKVAFKDTSPVAFHKDIGKLARNLPLHKIADYCFSPAAGSTKSLLIFIFLELHLKASRTIGKTVNDSTLASYLPASEDNASRGFVAVSAEAVKQKESRWEQLL
ncbi:hypothetical protein PMIN01_09677 [Paraphaeosphaeria minitans]|uniref:Uncharacterized protein n=1 Tax=Paraphaeosphaeria minitans TaxID=565426 RepID=A0A9P6KNR0_9PLEO|nr:hypothetical protein PMIN01_09677 [Paraphaeosphaeria minitans]